MVEKKNALLGTAYFFLAVFIADAAFTLLPYPLERLFGVGMTTWTSVWGSSNYAMNATMVENTYLLAGTATPILILVAVFGLILLIIFVIDAGRREFRV